jgi:hypothetical protein
MVRDGGGGGVEGGGLKVFVFLGLKNVTNLAKWRSCLLRDSFTGV